MSRRPPTKVTPPSVELDRPWFRRLAFIAGGCFVVGLAWPTLGGFQLVQRPPGSAPAKTEEPESSEGPEKPELEADPEPTRSPSRPPGPSLEARPERVESVPAARIQPVLTEHETVRLGETVVASCRDASDRPVARCDEPSLRAVITDPLERLARCEGAEGASGILSLGLELDFGRGRITHVKAGQSTTLSKETTAALLSCAENVVAGTPLDGVKHAQQKYWLYYLVRFRPPGSPLERSSDAAQDEVIPTSGRGTIGWKTAVVREAPTDQAQIAARLLYGTRVNVTGRRGEWYRIDYDGKGSVGWVDRKAIGM